LAVSAPHDAARALKKPQTTKPTGARGEIAQASSPELGTQLRRAQVRVLGSYPVLIYPVREKAPRVGGPGAPGSLRVPPAGRDAKAGHDLWLVQAGRGPRDWRPMPAVGAGVVEIWIRGGTEHWVFYVAKSAEAVYVLHGVRQEDPRNERALTSRRAGAGTRRSLRPAAEAASVDFARDDPPSSRRPGTSTATLDSHQPKRKYLLLRSRLNGHGGRRDSRSAG